ncbi:MAG: hypothetical protein Q9208_008760 [Pyrenodesmia sp. 3 TL-2023]
MSAPAFWASIVKRRTTPSASKTGSVTSGILFREGKNPKVANQIYETALAEAGIHMRPLQGQPRVAQEDKVFCEALLARQYPVPSESLFEDNLFETTCGDIANRNEARVIQDIGRLIAPSPEEQYRRGTTEFKNLIQTDNECWLMAVPMLDGPRPQPDFAVGFRRSAFTPRQLEKLKPAIGDYTLASRITATYEMLFPFFTDEVKCGKQSLEVANRQNAHNGGWTANSVVELYRMVEREKELHQKILSFSLSHDHNKVDLYGHYVLIEGKRTAIHRHPIYSFDFTTREGQNKWIAYNFTLAVYKLFAPIHLQRLTSAIDQLPGPEAFGVAQLSELSLSNSSSSSQGQRKFVNSTPQTFEAQQHSKRARSEK